MIYTIIIRGACTYTKIPGRHFSILVASKIVKTAGLKTYTIGPRKM